MDDSIVPAPGPSVLEYLTRVRDTACPWLLARTVALMKEKPVGVLRPHGTGVLLAIADDAFLISAAHVLAEVATDQMWIHPAAAAPNLLPLDGVIVNTTENRGAVDFGFVRLAEDVRAELAKSKQFVRLSEIEMNLDDSHGWYAAFGFPAEVNPTSTGGGVEVRPFYYGTKLHDWSSDRPNLGAFDPKLNVALEYAWSKSADHSGAVASLPRPNGLSGCGIWRLFVYDGVRRGEWTTDAVRLVAIQHSHVGVKRKLKK